MRCQLEAGELKRRRHRAADQCESAERLSRLPRVCRHHGVRRLPVGEGRPKNDGTNGTVTLGDMQGQRLARVEMPNLDGVDAVPAGALAFAQQVIDLTECAAPAAGRRIAKGFPVPAALTGCGNRLS
jgi:hypothetical protein